MAEARRLMGLNQFAEARRRLVPLFERRPDDPEIGYRLGVCAHAAGDFAAALAAWSRIGPNSDWGARAGLARARTLVGDLGRFAEAEPLLENLLTASGGAAREEARHTLAELYFWEGRRDDVRRLIERAWPTGADLALELKDHWRAENAPALIETIRAEVETAAKRAPEDDRVWLAEASLALQEGRLSDARAKLDACAKRRPDDPAVWRARWRLARAANDLDAARAALRRLPADRFREDQVRGTRAWLAGRLGVRDAERLALEQAAAGTPHDIEALDRLAQLEWDAGRRDRAREHRRRKAELDAARDRYRNLIDEKDQPPRLAELATLAETLGRRFEALGWWTLRAHAAPSDRAALDGLARWRKRAAPSSSSSSSPPAGATLADLCADIDPALKAPSSSLVAVDQIAPAARPAGRSARFVDRAADVGLRFVFDNGRSPQRQLPETTAGGVGLLDYNGDGRLDVYVVQGGVFPPDPARPSTGDRLFRNRGDGTFEDVSGPSGIARLSRGYGHGVTVGDFDNDGWPDLFLTRWRAYALFRNRGDGTFEDVTERVGLGGDRDWPTSAAFADLDNDGDLDLYVCHYLVWDAERPRLCRRVTSAARDKLVDPDQEYNYCTPRPIPALPDHLFRNDGGRFVDVTREAGIVDRDGRGLGVTAADVDDDGLIDLFVANDTTANDLWHNLGGMKFEQLGAISGVACNASGAFQAGMGTALGDIDGDGLPDLFVTNFYGESTTCFRNLGSGMFADQTAAVGLAGPTRFLLGFGIVAFDANNDGWMDLTIANGHVNDDRPDYPYAMPASLLLGGPDGRLAPAATADEDPWSVLRVGRGLAVGDLDNDGRLDVLLLAQKGPLGYFHNQSKAGGSLTLRLEGTRSNRDAVGAVVTIEAAGRRRRAWRHGGGSFQSSSSPLVHFGLGADRVDQVEVRWPSGRVERFGPIEAGRGALLREGAARPAPLEGFGPARQ